MEIRYDRGGFEGLGDTFVGRVQDPHVGPSSNSDLSKCWTCMCLAISSIQHLGNICGAGFDLKLLMHAWSQDLALLEESVGVILPSWRIWLEMNLKCGWIRRR